MLIRGIFTPNRFLMKSAPDPKYVKLGYLSFDLLERSYVGHFKNLIDCSNSPQQAMRRLFQLSSVFISMIGPKSDLGSQWWRKIFARIFNRILEIICHRKVSQKHPKRKKWIWLRYRGGIEAISNEKVLVDNLLHIFISSAGLPLSSTRCVQMTIFNKS